MAPLGKDWGLRVNEARPLDEAPKLNLCSFQGNTVRGLERFPSSKRLPPVTLLPAAGQIRRMTCLD